VPGSTDEVPPGLNTPAEPSHEFWSHSNDIEVGNDFTEVIREHLQRTDELVVLWTPWSLARPFVTAEVSAAWGLGIPIIQVLDDVTAAELSAKADHLPFLKILDMVQLNDFDTYLEQLQWRIGRVRAGSEGEGSDEA
jgi:hypothetical protein